MTEEDKKLNELDLIVINQLHNSTLNFSKASITVKQMLLTLVAIVAPIIVKFSGDTLDLSLFVSMYVLITLFWILDSFTYYYQEKMRFLMDEKFNAIKNRVSTNKIITMRFTIERKKKNVIFSVLHSLFNWSEIFYLMLVFVNSIAFVLFIKGKIG